MEQQTLKSGDSPEEVINFYSNMVYRLSFARTGNKYDADDIFQEVFMKYIKKQPKFESEEHRKAWLIRVTVNCSKNFWGSSWQKKTELLEKPKDEAIPFEDEEDISLYHGIMKLPPKYRSVIHLFYYEDLSIEDISRVLEQKKSTIRTQLTRARYKLKEILKEEEDV